MKVLQARRLKQHKIFRVLLLHWRSRRLAESDPSRREAIRRRQDLSDELSKMDSSLLNFASVRSPNAAVLQDQLNSKIRSVEAEIQSLDSELGKGPDATVPLTGVATVLYQDLKKMLAPDEALISFAIGNDTSYTFVATHDRLNWYRVNVGFFELRSMIANLRCGVDVQQWQGSGRSDCEAITGSSPSQGNLPFSAQTAYALYRRLLSPAEEVLKGRALIFALPEPLSSLPPNVWITAPPPEQTGVSGFVGLQWLVRSHSTSVIPSVSSLAVLRGNRISITGKDTRKLYVGFADPALVGNAKCPKPEPVEACSTIIREARDNGSRKLALLASLNAQQTYVRGGLANVSAVREICPLPDTEREVTCVARALSSSRRDLYVGPRMTETALKKLPLGKYRILHFATHGLLADQVRNLGGISEPALVLTPPAIPTQDDDGLLTASEIAQLRVNADLVILSACNTAGANMLETDALSGLARAFFYAGARTLMVSHWAVDSGTTVGLISRAIALVSENKGMGPADAMRFSILVMIDNPSLAHPSKWAPFVVVGEGRAFR